MNFSDSCKNTRMNKLTAMYMHGEPKTVIMENLELFPVKVLENLEPYTQYKCPACVLPEFCSGGRNFSSYCASPRT